MGEPSKFKEFRETFNKRVNQSKLGFLFYLIPITLLSVLLYVVNACYFVLIVPFVAIAIPYYLGFRGIKKFAVLGLFILLTNTLAVGAVSAQRALDYNNFWASDENVREYVEPQNSTGDVLSMGVVSPKVGSPDTNFTYTVLYKSDLPPNYVKLFVVDTPLSNGHVPEERTMIQTNPGDTNYENGVEFRFSTTLSSEVPPGHPWWPNHFFYFETENANGTWDTTIEAGSLTSFGFGPMNADPLNQYGYSTFWAFSDMIFVIILFYLGLGMYWWLGQAKIKSTQWQERMEAMQREEVTEFECDRCGADVPEDAERCPKCGASFEEEGEEEEKEPPKEIEDEFECDSCGADVPGDAEECPVCGEVFEE